jgi:hypothetical protein
MSRRALLLSGAILAIRPDRHGNLGDPSHPLVGVRRVAAGFNGNADMGAGSGRKYFARGAGSGQ